MAIRFDHKPGLVIYLTVGDPTLEATRAIALAAIDAGADVIELGVPFSDPLADGPVIQRAMERAVARGTRLKDVIKLAREIRAARREAGLVIFTYFNPVLRYGLTKFADDAAAAGVDGVSGDRPDCRRGWRVSLRDGPRGACADFSGRAHQSRRAAGGHRDALQRFCVRHLSRGHHRQAAEPDHRTQRRWWRASGDGLDPPGRGCRWLWVSASATRNMLPRWPSSRMPQSSAAQLWS